MEQKLLAFKARAKELLEDNPELTKIYLVKSKICDDWGLMMVEDSQRQNETESHCQECFEDFYPFKFRKTEKFPYKQISIIISPRKLEAINSGKLKFLDTLNMCQLLVDREQDA